MPLTDHIANTIEALALAAISAIENTADVICDALTAACPVVEPIDFGFDSLTTVRGSQLLRDVARSDRRDARRYGVAA